MAGSVRYPQGIHCPLGCVGAFVLFERYMVIMVSLGKAATSSLLLLSMSVAPVGTSFIPEVKGGFSSSEFAVASSGAEDSALKMNDELIKSYSDLLMF